MNTRFHSLTSFFYNFIGSNSPVTAEFLENFDAIQYYFFTNFLAYKYLYDIQIFLRFSIKVDYSYSDFLLPVDLLYLHQQAEKIEEERKKTAEESAAEKN